jgi:hypothetical protein
MLSMTEHRYTLGDLVCVRMSARVHPVGVGRSSAEINDNGPSGIHEITRRLPELVRGEPRYVIRSCADQADYVVRESELMAPPLPPKPDQT